MANEQKPVTILGKKQRFKDGTLVTQEDYENEPGQAAMDRAEAIDEDELEEELQIIDELLEHPERSKELSTKGGISYPKP